jgi:hypothetical protein
MGVNDRVDTIIAYLDKEKPDLRELANHITETIPTVEVLEWARLAERIKAVYGISDSELEERIRAPEFTQDGGYYDDFTPIVHTESPPAYHFACALTVLGAALRRQVFVDQAIFKIWPAMQVLVLGPSGKTHKSTAANYAVQLGEDSGRVYKVADEITPPSLRRELSDLTEKYDEACALIYASELSNLLGKQDYNEGLIQTLTDIYDCRVRYLKKTKTAGEDHIKDMAVSFLGCSNEGWASYSLPVSAISGGFVGRHILFYQSGIVKRVPRPKLNDPKEYQRLVSILQLTTLVKGEMKLSAEGETWFAKKYDRIHDFWPEDPMIDPFWSRYGDHLMRLAMLIRVSDIIEAAYEAKKPVSGYPLEITPREFEQADALILWLMRYLPRVYNFLGVTKFGEDYQRIIQFIARKGGRVTDTQLGRAMSKRMSRKQLDEYLDSLVENLTIQKKAKAPPFIDGKWEYSLRRKVEEM